MRKELLSSLELAKSSLHTEIRNLEKGLKEEKRGHCETKNRLILQEHECANLRVDRRSLRTGKYHSESKIFTKFHQIALSLKNQKLLVLEKVWKLQI